MPDKKYVLPFEEPIFEMTQKLEDMKKLAQNREDQNGINSVKNFSKDIKGLEKKISTLKQSIYQNLTRWERVQVARHPNRPFTLDYIRLMTEDFVELHGDRSFKDDKAIVGGFARLSDKKSFSQTVMLIGHQKGRDTKSNLYRNFGMAEPEGYRKAIRLMKLAEKFSVPVITLIDTPGAAPGIGAEERGQAEAIARSMYEMAKLRTPIICVIIGEGASGGAIGIGVGDKILMLENAWYSVISPESCSSILWRNWEHKEEAAEALKLIATDLLGLKIIDEIIPEPMGGAHSDHENASSILKESLIKHLKPLLRRKKDKLVENRITKFSKMGNFQRLKN